MPDSVLARASGFPFSTLLPETEERPVEKHCNYYLGHYCVDVSKATESQSKSAKEQRHLFH